MNLQIEVGDGRRIIDTAGFKIYGSDTELRQIADAIETALRDGMVQGWVGVGVIDSNSVFPFNGRDNIPSKFWDK